MKCISCGCDNRDQAVFCKRCGEPMTNKLSGPLNDLVGKDDIKEQLCDLVKICESVKARSRQGGGTISLGMDILIMGHTGTGKTRLANVLQTLFFTTGIIKKPQITLVDAVDWDEYEKSWDENIEKARGGLLCIENVQKLLPDDYSQDIEKLDRLFTSMDRWQNDPIVILSGLPRGFRECLDKNPNIRNRFEYFFELPEFTPEQMTDICARELSKQYGLTLTSQAEEKLGRIFMNDIRDRQPDFGNGHTAKKKAEEIFTCVMKRDSRSVQVEADDIHGVEFKERTTEEIMGELDKFVGVDSIKRAVEGIIADIELGKMRGGEQSKPSIRDHFVFTGNPGTGKTTIARVFADILNALGVLPIGQLVEADRDKLVGQYQGHTAVKTNELVDRAMGGILFIDEAYALKNNEGDSFGQEAIDTLLKRLEDDRGKFVCIAAGYTKEMFEFMESNSGLKSRFNKTIEFKDYDGAALTEIFRRMVKAKGFTLDQQADENIGNFFGQMYMMRTKNFGNAREVRTTFDDAVTRQGERLRKIVGNDDFDREQLTILTRADIEGDEAGKTKSADEVMESLKEFVGMESVKRAIRTIANKMRIEKMRMERGLSSAETTPLNIVLTGNPGTGKTTVARKLGEIFKAIKVLPTDRIIETDKSGMVSPYENDTAKVVDKLVDRAMGGILFVDEAYALADDKHGQEAIEKLMKRMEDDRGKFAVVLAGYQHRMDDFLRVNPGLKSRMSHTIHIDDYSADELAQIFRSMVSKKHYTLTPQAEEQLGRAVDDMVAAKSNDFGNAREIRKMFDATIDRMSQRLVEADLDNVTDELFTTIEAVDIPCEQHKTIDEKECMDELEALVGLESVKQEVRLLVKMLNIQKIRCEQLGEKFQGARDHYLFLGNPGTGKTTVARIMANIFFALGVTKRHNVIEVSRANLVGETVGSTAPKVNQVVNQAMGSLLFIDEAYSLKQRADDSFGQEAIDTLLQRLENDRGKFVCIAAGYTREMNAWLNSNSGLTSRFNRTIVFEDYNGEALASIFRKKADAGHYVLSPEADRVMAGKFESLYENRGRNFGNAREVNNLFQDVLKRQSERLSQRMAMPDFDKSELYEILPEDFE